MAEAETVTETESYPHLLSNYARQLLISWYSKVNSAKGAHPLGGSIFTAKDTKDAKKTFASFAVHLSFGNIRLLHLGW